MRVRLLVSTVDTLGNVGLLVAHADAEADVRGPILVAQTVHNVALDLVDLLAL